MPRNYSVFSLGYGLKDSNYTEAVAVAKIETFVSREARFSYEVTIQNTALRRISPNATAYVNVPLPAGRRLSEILERCKREEHAFQDLALTLSYTVSHDTLTDNSASQVYMLSCALRSPVALSEDQRKQLLSVYQLRKKAEEQYLLINSLEASIIKE
jgi:hypothetical protein